MEPNWQAITQISPAVPENIRDWLTAEMSLTSRLRDLGTFTIKILKENWGLATSSECLLLQIKETAQTWRRDVALLVDNEPKVIAHTVIPVESLQALPELQNLGERSLGDLIFRDLQGTRDALQFASLSSDHTLFKLTKSFHTCNQLWARRSLLTAKGHTLIVNEIFIQ